MSSIYNLILKICIVYTLCILSLFAYGEEIRSHTVLRHFQLTHPCPSTGRPHGDCPGYVKDHINPLACGGPDTVNNLQWQTITDGKAKDKWERIGCKNGKRSIILERKGT